MSFIKINIPRPTKAAAGAPQGKDPNVVIFDWDDILTSPSRDSKGIKMVGGFVFKEGKYAIKIYATTSSISAPRTSEGEEDAVSWQALPEFSHPGSSLEIEEFFANMTNRGLGVGIRVGECDGEEAFYKIYGTRCNPLSLLVEGQDNNEGLKDIVRFQQSRRSSILPGRYYGTFTFDESEVVPEGAAEISVAAGSGEYQLQDNAAATEITNLIDAIHGGTYTIVGSGGDNPSTIASGGNFILAGATDWQGLAGARLTLKAYQQAAGAFVFFEQSRS